MNTSKRPIFPGILLIALGLAFLAANLTPMRGRDMWPLFILGPGVLFYFLFFVDRSNYGLLMPATILTIMGLMFFYCVYDGWENMRRLWPLFIIGPGIGFFLMYGLGKKERGLLISASILTAVGLVFLFGLTQSEYFWPIFFIAIGIIILLRSRR